jgi:MOSC domain-containing protein YiiM
MQRKAVGNVLSLFIVSPEHKNTIENSEIEVDEKGILGDKHYDGDIDRSILVTSNDSYLMVKDHSIEIESGALGENILIDYNPYQLPVGSRLQIGTATLEITQPCTLCSHLSSIDKQVPVLLKHDRGIFAKTIKSGTIAQGDPIYLLQ